MKKRGFGQGLWNGVGGKANPGEAIEDTAKRECQEEIIATPKNLTKIAVLNFYSPPEKAQDNQQGHVFITRQWVGEPTETEEMRPQWFPINDIPFQLMWPGDKYWLPLVLKSKKFEADFFFDNNDQLINHEIRYLNI
jgi:8-oxo-dGTP pyrophosphatase MutT (NUDIX family)